MKYLAFLFIILLSPLVTGNAFAQLGGGGGVPSTVCTGGQVLVSFGPGGGVCGSPAASGSVNSGALNAIGKYATAGTAISNSTVLSDDGTNVYFAGPADLKSFPVATEVANASSVGTTNNHLAKLTGAPATALIAAITDTVGIVGVVVSGGGTTGNALIAVGGQVTCTFDNATVAGDYVTISSTTAGDCHDAGASPPAAGTTALGRVMVTGVAGNASTLLSVASSAAAGVTSVNTTVPAVLLTGSGCNITTSGTCAITLSSASANLHFMSPNGSSGAGLYRAPVAADFPANVFPYSKIQQASASTVLCNSVGSVQNIGECTLNPRIVFSGTTLDLGSASISNTYLAAGAASANVGTLGGDLGSTLAAGPSVLKIHGVAVPADPGGNDYILIRTAAGQLTYKQFCNGSFIGYSTASNSPTCPTQPNLSMTAGNPGISISPTPGTITSGALTISANFPVQTTKKIASYLLTDPGTCGAGGDPFSTIIFNSASALNAAINSSTASYFPPGCAVNILNVGSGTLTVCVGSDASCTASGSSTFYGGGGSTTSFTLATNCYAYIEADSAAPNLYMVNNSCAAISASTGAFVKISTQGTGGNPQWLQWTGLPTTYSRLHISCAGLVVGTNNSTFGFQVGEGATPTWEATAYYFGFRWAYSNTAASATTGGDVNGNGFSQINMTNADVATTVQNAGASLDADIDIGGLISSTTIIKEVSYHTTYTSQSDITSVMGGGGYDGDRGAITAVRVGVTANTLTGGQCTLYGMVS